MIETFSRSYITKNKQTNKKLIILEKITFRFPHYYMFGLKGHIGLKTQWKHLENTVNTHNKPQRAHAESSIKAAKAAKNLSDEYFFGLAYLPS